MCGIYGVYDQSAVKFERTVVEKMGAAIQHRGPDDSGVLAERNIIMGMQRLAIIDVQGGRQPIFNEDRSVAVICNGELYNFKTLRQSLREQGHKFATESDTEVIVHLYEVHGLDFIQYIEGMFALALWDFARKKLILARDRLGIKPLYVSVSESRLAFSSELKSFTRLPGFCRDLNPLAVREYLALGYVPAPMTMLKGIEKLPAGTLLIADDSGVQTRKYWQQSAETNDDRADEDWAKLVRHAIEESVVRQMVSDVPLGAFLSGGVDSSAVVAFMAKNSHKPVNTYSIGFDNNTGAEHYNELQYARQIAEYFKTDHREIIVKPDVARLLPNLIWHLDEPLADAAFITTYLVSRFARDDVTVILSGVGGDELFGGYRRYWSENLTRIYRRIPGLLRSGVVRPISRLLPSDRHSMVFDYLRLAKGFIGGAELSADERYEQFVRVFDFDKLRGVVGSDVTKRSRALEAAFANADDSDAVNRLIQVDMQTQLPDDLLMLTDRMSMAVSLECRVPLLDEQLVNLASQMPSRLKVRGSKLKFVMKEALSHTLPDNILHRSKRGFGAPIGAWFKNELSEFVNVVLDERSVRERGIIEWSAFEDLVSKHRSNREDHTDHILAVLNLELWCRIYLDGDSPAAVSEEIERMAAA